MASSQTHEHSLLSHRPRLEQLLPLITTASKSAEYCLLLDFYLDLPSLLDPILSHHVSHICNQLHNHLSNPITSSSTALIPIATALYTLVKVRGPKRIPPYFPHSVATLRFLIPLILHAEVHLRTPEFWHVRYCLYTWLSVAIRVPFPLHTILTPEQLDSSISHAREALLEPGPVSLSAQTFLSRLFSRRDVSATRVRVINATCLQVRNDSAAFIPALSLLASLFKHAHRDDMQPHIHDVLPLLSPLVDSESSAPTKKAHLISKLSHRVALAFLPPRPAAWRYLQRHMKLDIANGADGNVDEIESMPVPDISEKDSEALETVVDLLITSLSHRDTVVRWSAAKGLSRITCRLPSEQAVDVIAFVLSIFDDIGELRADASWHGACLCLAELARRGLILPDHPHFGDMFHALAKAAKFDVRKGSISIGDHVRDAACYTVWAISRAYHRTHVQPYADIIAQSMLPLALLDREINCRRAAAAALQECVGRLSAIDRGIELITFADYFALGDRTAAYLGIAQNVVQLNEKYFKWVLEELYQTKLKNWDKAVRQLAAKSLAGLVGVKGENGVIVRDVVPILARRLRTSTDMILVHGVVVAFSELALIIGVDGFQKVAEQVRDVPMYFKKKAFLSGRTGDDMRIACCQLIRTLAKGAHELYSSSPEGMCDAEQSLAFLEDILGCGKEEMYAPAASAYHELCDNVIRRDEEWHVKVTRRVLNGITQSKFSEHQRGYALAAGVCGDSKISDERIRVLCGACCENKDVEVRRNAAESLGRISKAAHMGYAMDILRALGIAMKDYATDDRGDVGSWVREASMRSTASVVKNLVEGINNIGEFPSVDAMETIILASLCDIVEQCCSRIDRTRGVAGASLHTICQVFAVPDGHSKVMRDLCSEVSRVWRFSNDKDGVVSDVTERDERFFKAENAFLMIRKLLFIPKLSKAVTCGFIYASGGTGSQGILARSAYNIALFKRDHDALKGDVDEILEIVERGNHRLTLPALNLLDAIVQTGALSPLGDLHLKRVANTVRRCWRTRIGNVKQTSSAVQVLSSLASAYDDTKFLTYERDSVGKACLEALVVILGCAIPRLRRITAEILYMLLLQTGVDPHGSLQSENGDAHLVMAAIDILLDTTWEIVAVHEARIQRNKICEFLSIDIPKAVARRIAG